MGVVADDDAPPAATARTSDGRWRVMTAAAAAAFALLGVGWATTKRPAPPAAAVAAPVATVDVGSTNGEAVAAYRAGVDALHDASGGTARRNFDRAIALDPAFAAAHLRKVLATPWVGDAERESMRKATQLRATLNEHDRALLHAVEPWVAVPQDVRDVEARLAELAKAHQDPEYFYQLCRFRVLGGKYDRAAEACRAARELDSHFAGAFWLEGQSALYTGDTSIGLASLDVCLRLSPTATSCINDSLQMRLNEGQCDAALGDAERLAAIQPESTSLVDLGIASYGAGKSLVATHAIYERAIELLPADDSYARYAIMSRLAVTAGRFDDALADIDNWERAVTRSTDEKAHVDPFIERGWLLREIGREAALVDTARAVLANHSAWSPSVEVDGRIAALVALYRGGAMSHASFVAERAAILDHVTETPEAGTRGSGAGRRWIAAYADAVVTQQDALDAMEALPHYLPLPTDRFRLPSDDESVGAAMLLAGHTEDAISFLTRAAHSCRAARFPLQYVWSNVELGAAFESTGNIKAACDAYRRITGRLGNVASSRSAARATARLLALGCR